METTQIIHKGYQLAYFESKAWLKRVLLAIEQHSSNIHEVFSAKSKSFWRAKLVTFSSARDNLVLYICVVNVLTLVKYAQQLATLFLKWP